MSQQLPTASDNSSFLVLVIGLVLLGTCIGLSKTVAVVGEHSPQHAAVDAVQEPVATLPDEVPSAVWPAELEVAASHLDRGRMTTLAVMSSEPKTNSPVERAQESGPVIGQVFDHNGQPIADAVVTNYAASRQGSQVTRTDQDGRFRFDRFLVNSTQWGHVAIVAPDFMEQVKSLRGGTEAAPSEVEFNLKIGGIQHVIVTDEHGQPISDAVLLEQPELKSDANGRIRWSGIRWQESSITLMKPGYSSVSRHRITVDGSTTTLVMPKASVLPLNVIDGQTGKAVTEFVIELKRPLNKLPEGAVYPSLPHAWDRTELEGRSQWPMREIASPDGKYVWPELNRAEAFSIRVSASGYLTTVLPAVVARSPSETEFIPVPLTPVAPDSVFTVHGQVLDDAGHAVPKANIVLVEWATASDITSVDPYIQPRSFLRRWPQWNPNCIAVRIVEARDDGTFDIPHVQLGYDIDIAFWSDRFPRSLMKHVQRLPQDQLQQLTLRDEGAGTLMVNWDAQKWNALGHDVQIRRLSSSRSARRPVGQMLGQDSMRIENLSPGELLIELVPRLGSRLPVVRTYHQTDDTVGRGVRVTIEANQAANVTLQPVE